MKNKINSAARPAINASKGNGKTKTFRLSPPAISTDSINVFHSRGGSKRTPPVRITKDAIVFAKAPQKGNKITVLYIME